MPPAELKRHHPRRLATSPTPDPTRELAAGQSIRSPPRRTIGPRADRVSQRIVELRPPRPSALAPMHTACQARKPPFSVENGQNELENAENAAKNAKYRPKTPKTRSKCRKSFRGVTCAHYRSPVLSIGPMRQRDTWCLTCSMCLTFAVVSDRQRRSTIGNAVCWRYR